MVLPYADMIVKGAFNRTGTTGCCMQGGKGPSELFEILLIVHASSIDPCGEI